MKELIENPSIVLIHPGHCPKERNIRFSAHSQDSDPLSRNLSISLSNGGLGEYSVGQYLANLLFLSTYKQYLPVRHLASDRLSLFHNLICQPVRVFRGVRGSI